MPRKYHSEFEDGDPTLYNPVTTGRGTDQTTGGTIKASTRHHPKPGAITDGNGGSHGAAVGFAGLGITSASEDTAGSL